MVLKSPAMLLQLTQSHTSVSVQKEGSPVGMHECDLGQSTHCTIVKTQSCRHTVCSCVDDAAQYTDSAV